MKKNRKKKGKHAETVKMSGSRHATTEQQNDEPAFSRWALFEGAVLSKVANTEKCKTVIAQRQIQVDDDSNEADLVAAHLRQKLHDKKQNPDTCCLFFTTAEITTWLQEATGNKYLPINKTTPYLRTLAIAESVTPRRTACPAGSGAAARGSPDRQQRCSAKSVSSRPTDCQGRLQGRVQCRLFLNAGCFLAVTYVGPV